MGVNVGRFNKAMKPLLEEPEETDAYRDAAAAVSSIGAGLGAYMKQNMAIKKEEREEQAIIEQQQREKERQKALFDREEKSKAVLDFANFQGEMTNAFDKLQSSDRLDYIKESNNAFINGKEKYLKGKSAAYRESFSQLATDYYTKITPELVKTNSENTIIREASNIENAAKVFLENNNDPEILNNLDNFLNGQIDGMDIKDWQKDMMKRQSSKMFTTAAINSMVQQDPDAAKTYIENDPKVNSLFNDKEIGSLLKVCDDSKFNQLADQNPVALYQTMMDKEKAKDVFSSMDEKEIEKYQTKSKKILDNYKNQVKQVNEQRKQTLINDFNNNPTQERFEQLKLSVPDLKKSQIDDMQTRLDFIANEKAETVNTKIIPAIEDFVNVLDNSKANTTEDFLTLTENLTKIKNVMMNYNKDGFMDSKAFEKYDKLLSTAFQKEMIEQIQDEMPLLKPLLIEGKKVLAGSDKAKEKLFTYEIQQAKQHSFRMDISDKGRSKVNNERIAKVVNDTVASYMFKVITGDKEGALEDLSKAKQKVAELKYPEIKGLQKGDYVVKNNVIYTYEGLNGTDAIISVK